MDERRRAERVRTLLKAKVYFNNRTRSYDCVVKNISTHGARIALDKNAAIPNEFELDIPMRGRAYQAKLRWRDTEGAGVEFADDSLQNQSNANAEYDKLMAENMRLKKLILVLTKKLEDLGQDVPRL